MVSSGKDIQPNNNWAKVHNGILEVLASTNFTARELRCLLYLLRMTYGERCKENAISLNNWTQGTGLKRPHVIATLQSLVTRNIIIKTDTGTRTAPIWAFNKYFEQWRPSTPVGTFTGIPKGTSDSTHVGTLPSTQEGTKGSTPVLSISQPHIEREEERRVEQSPLPASTADVTVKQFIASVKRYWALLPDSDYTANKLVDWTKRVPLEAWDYALEECVNRAKVGQWGYLDSILRRVEREGVQTKRNGSAPIAAPVVDIAKPEVKAWQI